MKTGEGKTLVSTLPVYLNALEGNGVHVVTVNDYLAARDAGWMGQVHRALGLTVGRVTPDLPDWQDKKDAYNSDITYGTIPSSVSTTCATTWPAASTTWSSGATTMRSSTRSTRSSSMRPGHRSSSPARPASRRRLYYQFAGVARSLVPEQDYEVDEEKRTIAPTEDGIEKVESLLGVDNLYDLGTANLVHQLTKALQAKELYKRDKDYLVADGEVKIVDEFTGRILEGRRWSDGLHQAVEAKERVPIKEENHTWATVTLAELFPHVRQVVRDDRYRSDRSGRVRFRLTRSRWYRSPPTCRWSARTTRTSFTGREGQVCGRRRRCSRAPRKRPARPGRHRLGGEIRGAVENVHQARHPAPGPQRQSTR